MDELTVPPGVLPRITQKMDELTAEAEAILADTGMSGEMTLPPRYTEITGTLKGIAFVLGLMVPSYSDIQV